jgi:hypothetical protein
MIHIFTAPAICKECIHFKTQEKTCARSIVAGSKKTVIYDFAKYVSEDPKRCGPAANWFQEAEP